MTGVKEKRRNRSVYLLLAQGRGRQNLWKCENLIKWSFERNTGFWLALYEKGFENKCDIQSLVSPISLAYSFAM